MHIPLDFSSIIYYKSFFTASGIGLLIRVAVPQDKSQLYTRNIKAEGPAKLATARGTDVRRAG